MQSLSPFLFQISVEGLSQGRADILNKQHLKDLFVCKIYGDSS